jgi:putative ABC transport system permease protein
MHRAGSRLQESNAVTGVHLRHYYKAGMSTFTRGIKNAFRNGTRTVSVVLILGLAIALAFVMLIAHRAVGAKVSTTLSAVGNTVSVGPPGYSVGGMLGTRLTSAEVAPIARLPHVTGVDESLDGAVTASNLPPRSARGPANMNVKRLGGPSAKKHASAALQQGRTSLEYPGTLAAATAGLECQPKPCTPPISSFTIYFTGSTEPTAPVNIGASALKIVSGRVISGPSSADNVMISREMARRNGLKVGSTFTAYGRILTVAAIFQSNSQQGNDTVITSLPTLQRLGHTGEIFTATVTASSLGELSKVTAEIERVLGKRASVVSYVADAEQAVSDLGSVKRIALDSLIGALGAAIVILFLVMVVIVRERKREIAILKAIGAPNRRVIAQFTSEAVTFTLLGLVIGLVVGAIAASPVTSSLVSHSGVAGDTGARGIFGAGSPVLTRLSHINAQIGVAAILEGIAAALLVAVLASAAAAWLISRVRPAEVLRSV